MSESAEFLIAIGGLLLVGLATDLLGKRTFLPRVTLLLLVGILAGESALDLIPDSLSSRFELIADVALVMIGFLLGGRLQLKSMKTDGAQVFWISISAALGTAFVVAFALILIGFDPQLAILLACIASATDPAATVDTVLESGINNRFSRILLAIVAIDDAWALILFSLGLVFVTSMNGHAAPGSLMLHAFIEIFGAVVLGLLIGFPASFLTGRIKPGQPMLTEALGIVFLCVGLALWLEVSFVIAAMTIGAVITNFARHHDFPFHEIENIEWPFMVIFFVLAGASLEIGMLNEIGLIGFLYLLARIIGKLSGAWVGGKISHAEIVTQRWMGMTLLPQAGVAIGMGLIAASRFPQYQQEILTLVISTTVFFEIMGPVFARMAIRRASE